MPKAVLKQDQLGRPVAIDAEGPTIVGGRAAYAASSRSRLEGFERNGNGLKLGHTCNYTPQTLNLSFHSFLELSSRPSCIPPLVQVLAVRASAFVHAS